MSRRRAFRPLKCLDCESFPCRCPTCAKCGTLLEWVRGEGRRECPAHLDQEWTRWRDVRERFSRALEWSKVERPEWRDFEHAGRAAELLVSLGCPSWTALSLRLRRARYRDGSMGHRDRWRFERDFDLPRRTVQVQEDGKLFVDSPGMFL